MTQHPLDRARRLRQEGKTSEALAGLRRALVQGELRPHEMATAGRALLEWAAADPPVGDGSEPLAVLVAGQCTTSWLAPATAAWALTDDVLLSVREGDYDNVMQEVCSGEARAFGPRAVVLVPWSQRLFAEGARTDSERREEELGFWGQVWSVVGDRLRSRIVQVGYDWVDPGAEGFHLSGARGGEVARIRRLNQELRERMPEGSYFVDLSLIAGDAGRRRFYDPRRYFWTRQPFSEVGVAELARHLWAGIRAVTTGPRKALVLDLDDTLWGGIVGEEGARGVALGETPEGEAFLAFQRFLKRLQGLGTLLCVASKNNESDAMGPFRENPEMVLRRDDFAAFRASWEEKHREIVEIATSLDLGSDSFAFFDDNPVEREQMRQLRPEVAVVDTSGDPADYSGEVVRSLLFERSTLTESDLGRAEQYRARAQRELIAAAAVSREEYLESLEMKAEVSEIEERHLVRVAQMVGKINQFNLTTRRHSLEQIRHLLGIEGAIARVLRLRDRFGDYGWISLVLALPDERFGPGGLAIESWLMSCRAIGRTVENALFAEFVRLAREAGYRYLLGEYLPTLKNAPVADLYPSLGFEPVGPSSEDGTLYRMELSDSRATESFVELSLR